MMKVPSPFYFCWPHVILNGIRGNTSKWAPFSKTTSCPCFLSKPVHNAMWLSPFMWGNEKQNRNEQAVTLFQYSEQQWLKANVYFTSPKAEHISVGKAFKRHSQSWLELKIIFFRLFKLSLLVEIFVKRSLSLHCCQSSHVNEDFKSDRRYILEIRMLFLPFVLFPREFVLLFEEREVCSRPRNKHTYCRSLAAVARGSHEQWKLQ